jgi:hypothetical protein
MNGHAIAFAGTNEVVSLADVRRAFERSPRFAADRWSRQRIGIWNVKRVSAGDELTVSMPPCARAISLAI